ncbi:MAG: N-acetyltransferase [Clostridia bacterium]|nr:N-acetyltransferase [Clostridia bacterium]
MYIRKAIPADLPEIRRVYDAAKAYMDRSGNPNQWKAGYPPAEVLKDDIARGQLYVVETNVCSLCSSTIHGVFAFIPGEDPTYLRIDGEWLREAPYAAIHRVASDGVVRGVFREAVAYCRAVVGSGIDLRIDTHEDNLTMQHVIEREGFMRCGIIYLANGAPRIAYQWIGAE